MIQTNRIQSGFDLEMQLGAGWFRTAIQILIDNGVIAFEGLPIVILDVRISTDPDWDLEIDVPNILFGGVLTIKANIALSEDGSELNLTFDNTLIDPQTLPFDALRNLSGTPRVIKVAADDTHDAAICLLANLQLHTNPQSGEPFTPEELVSQERGTAEDAISFLPTGQDIAFGVSESTLTRFANNLWHTELRAADGSHPLPDAENKQGDWHRVRIWGDGGTIKIELQGEVPIDIWPDADVTITISLTPSIRDGKLVFDLDSKSNVDTGILGDIFAFLSGGLIGGLIGFILALISGGALLPAVLIGAGIGATVGVVLLEVGEVIVEGIVQKNIKAMIEGEDGGSVHCSEEGIVQLATPKPEAGLNLSLFDTIPSSIPLIDEQPENELLYKRTVLISTVYNDLTVNANGFAACGMSTIEEKFAPKVISLSAVTYENDALQSLTFQRENGNTQTLTVAEVIERAQQAELKAPFKMFNRPAETDLRIPEGKIACVCLTPKQIKQIDTIVDEIEFDNGIKMKVPDIIQLQNAAALVVIGYQLIHPREYNSYYRAKADFFTDNNLESLPKYE